MYKDSSVAASNNSGTELYNFVNISYYRSILVCLGDCGKFGTV